MEIKEEGKKDGKKEERKGETTTEGKNESKKVQTTLEYNQNESNDPIKPTEKIPGHRSPASRANRQHCCN